MSVQKQIINRKTLTSSRPTAVVLNKLSIKPALQKKYGVLKLADLFNYEMAKIMYQFSIPHVLIAYLTRSLPYMNAALDLKLSKIFIFLNSQPPGVKILLNIKDQTFGTL